MSYIKVPYPEIQKPTIYGNVCYPGLVVEVWIPSKGYQSFEFILDSGADITMAPRGMAKLVGVRLPRKADTWIYGIKGQKMAGYKGELKLRINGEEFGVKCLFTKSDKTPFLIGRVDFFSLFNVHFDNRNAQIILERLN